MFKIYDETLVKSFKKKVEKLVGNFQEKGSDEGTVHKMLISKEVVDRDWEIIKLDWLDTKRYKKNPVVLIDHRYTIDSIVGKTKKLYQEWNKLYADFVFANTEKAKLIEEMFIEGFVNASSIWFMVAKRQEGNWNIIEQSELLERSIVVAWSNREALRQKNVDLYEKIDKSWLFEVSFKDCDCWDDEKETEEGKEEITLEKVYWELQEVKSLLNSFAEDKANKEQIEKEVEEAKAQKHLLQEINKATASALEKIKKL